MNTNIFTINQIPIEIVSITPVTVLPEYGTLTDYVKTIQVDYCFTFTDIHANQIPDLSAVKFSVVLDIDTSTPVLPTSGQYINFNNLVKEDFYPLAIEYANNSQEILDKVKFIRIRTGLDIEPPKIQEPKQLLTPFK